MAARSDRCIVCPATDIAEAERLGERMLGAVAGLQRPIGVGRPLSISVGIATSGPRPHWDAMLALADRALYAAKAAGRGRAMTA